MEMRPHKDLGPSPCRCGNHWSTCTFDQGFTDYDPSGMWIMSRQHSWKRKSSQAHKRSQAEPAPESSTFPLCRHPCAGLNELNKICLKIFLVFSLNFCLGEPKNPRTPSPVTKPLYQTVHWVFQPICPNYSIQK